MTLDKLKPGESARVREVVCADLRSRLLALGFAAGCAVTCDYTAPSGDPAAYSFGAGQLALRRRDAGKVELWD